jgi:putative MATE family efflux protein
MMKSIILLLCVDGFTAAHPSARSIHSFSQPSPHHRRHRCQGCHGYVTTTTAPASAGFCSIRKDHCRQRNDRLDKYQGRHTKILVENDTRSRWRSTFLLLSMEPGDLNEYNWTSQTVAIAVPSLAGMMTDPLLSLADTLFVGMLGSTVAMNGICNSGRISATAITSSSCSSSVPLAALGACTSIFHLCFHCFRATTSSTSSLVAAALVRDEQRSKTSKKRGEYDVDHDSIIQDHPQKNEAELIAQTSIQQSFIMGAFITTFLLVFGPQCLLAMGVSPHGGQPHLYASAMAYLTYRSVAAPAVVMLSASEGIFRGYGDVITPWKVSCLVSVLNLVLDPFCMFGGGRGVMYGLGMGIKGAAVATTLSQVGGALVYGRKLFQRGMLGRKNRADSSNKGDLKRQKRGIAVAILRANAAMMAKQGSLLLAWAYATSRATRLGHTIVASHQLALSIWMVVALILDGAGVAAQVLMAREWEGYQLARQAEDRDKSIAESAKERKRRAIKSLSLYMIRLSFIQGLVGSLAILLLQQSAPSFIFTRDAEVRKHLLTLLPYVAYQMTLVSVTLVTEALAIGGGRFKWLAGGTTASAVISMVRLRGAKDLVEIWSGVSKPTVYFCSSISPDLILCLAD